MAPPRRDAAGRAWFIPVRRRAPEEGAPSRRRWGLLAALALLGGYLLFCHGCHGDEDNELFVGGRNQVAVRDAK